MFNEQENLLSDEVYLEQASSGKRFANYIIDLIVFYIILICLGIIIGLVNPDLLNFLDNDSFGGILDRIISLFIYGISMGCIEAIGKGKTIGKLITGTKAVNQDGSTISTSTAFMRGFCRMVPFEQLSAFGNPSFPWHDKWTDTFVIDVKQSRNF